MGAMTATRNTSIRLVLVLIPILNRFHTRLSHLLECLSTLETSLWTWNSVKLITRFTFVHSVRTNRYAWKSVATEDQKHTMKNHHSINVLSSDIHSMYARVCSGDVWGNRIRSIWKHHHIWILAYRMHAEQKISYRFVQQLYGRHQPVTM